MKLDATRIETFKEIDEPVKLEAIYGLWWKGIDTSAVGRRKMFHIDGHIIDTVHEMATDDYFNAAPIIFPGGIDIHVHGREAFGHPLSPKEDAYTLSLALAQGGAVTAMHMPNLPLLVTDRTSYEQQVRSLNSARPDRPQPIMPFDAYSIILAGSNPIGDDIMHKLMWNTYAPPGVPTNFKTDKDVAQTLRNYSGHWVTAHLETIADVDESAQSHPLRRPPEAANNALRIALAANRSLIAEGKKPFHLHIAHVSTPEQVTMAYHFNNMFSHVPTHNGKSEKHVTIEITPQTLTTNYDIFAKQTGLDIRFGQQNPPIPHTKEMMAQLRNLTKTGYIDMFATDHAPHLISEKEKGMSGMPQASTAGQTYLNLVSQGVISYEDFVRMRTHEPAQVLEHMLDCNLGNTMSGNDASFTIVAKQPSRIRNDEVLSKCGWTPWENQTFSHTILGVVIEGTLYTQRALQKLGAAYRRNYLKV